MTDYIKTIQGAFKIKTLLHVAEGSPSIPKGVPRGGFNQPMHDESTNNRFTRRALKSMDRKGQTHGKG